MIIVVLSLLFSMIVIILSLLVSNEILVSPSYFFISLTCRCIKNIFLDLIRLKLVTQYDGGCKTRNGMPNRVDMISGLDVLRQE